MIRNIEIFFSIPNYRRSPTINIYIYCRPQVYHILYFTNWFKLNQCHILNKKLFFLFFLFIILQRQTDSKTNSHGSNRCMIRTQFVLDPWRESCKKSMLLESLDICTYKPHPTLTFGFHGNINKCEAQCDRYILFKLWTWVGFQSDFINKLSF